MEKNKLSIIIPAFNEENSVQKIIKKVANVNYPCDFEIIFINNGSIDLTLKKASEIKIHNLKIFSYKKNMGKGFAIKTGLSHATGNIYIIQDADLEYNPENIPSLIKPLINKKFDIALGNRFSGKNKKDIYYFGNKLFTFLVNVLYSSKIKDVETGYKAFTKEVANLLKFELNDFGFEIEFISMALKNRLGITEIPVDYRARTKKEGKKINWKDGIKTLFYILKFKFL